MQSSQQLRAHNYRATKRLDHTDHAAKKWTVSLWSYSMPPRRPKPFTIPVNLEYSYWLAHGTTHTSTAATMDGLSQHISMMDTRSLTD